jgi:glycosyltransferase involved in cell wall biosynthesis
MKIAHTLKFYPRTSGLYETAREIIQGELAQSIDARILDVREDTGYSNYKYDRGIQTCDLEWFKNADLYVMHQMIPAELLKEINKPIVVILHGTPEACYMSDIWDKANSFNLILELVKDKRMTFVTLWERHFHYWNNIAPGRVVYVPSCVDFDTFDPDIITPYKFNGKSCGKPNILFADTWRIVKDPFHVANAYKIFKKWHKKARLHIYCRPGDGKARRFFDNFLYTLSEGRDSFFGVYDGFNGEISRVMRGCDLVVTQQLDETRIVRESNALGTPVIQPDATYDFMYPEKFAEKIARVWEEILRGNPEYSRKRVRERAKKKFDLKTTIDKLMAHFKQRLNLV